MMATGVVNSQGIPLNRRSGPGISYPVVGSVADGATVTIVCQTTGTTESGPWGPTNLWDRLQDNTYVSDAFIYTGTNNMVAPPCGGVPQQPGEALQQTIQQRLDRFINDWNEKVLNYDDTVPEQCFSVAQAWAKKYLGLHDFTGAYARDIINQAGSDFTRVDYAPGKFPPPGAIVVFHECPKWEIGEAGHVDVCISATPSSFVGFDQNWGSDRRCRRITHDFAGVLGWLIPKRIG